jgi:hypothetical protein
LHHRPSPPECCEYKVENTAEFATNDTSITGSASKTVHITVFLYGSSGDPPDPSSYENDGSGYATLFGAVLRQQKLLSSGG